MDNIFCVSYRDTVSLVYDKKPNFDIVVFDYGSSDPFPKEYDLKFDVKTECKGDLMVQGINKIINTYGRFNHMCFFDDDIIIKVSDIEKLFDCASHYSLDLFAPSLSHDSHFSHDFTLNKGLGKRDVSWVEVMMPGFSYRFTQLLHKELQILDDKFNIKSGWGIDNNVFPYVLKKINGKCSILDDIIATHTKPVQSKGKVFSNDKTAHQEMHIIRKHYNE